ncbi:hypothetical protein TNCV_3695041 [Trichonephila clavipes]|nr:hypothetical protein TNCV_3695041 [Trichonephila clavipes]
MGYNDLRDIAPVLQGHACLYGQSIHAMFPQSFQMYTVVLEKQATKQLARLQELWWKQATEDLANEEAKWVKLKDKKKSFVQNPQRELRILFSIDKI